MSLKYFFFPSKKRTKDLSEFAFRNGYKFFEKDTFNTLTFLKDFQLFKKGSAKKVYNQITLESTPLFTTIHSFDYEYTISSGKHSERHRQTVYLAYCKSLGMPELFMRPEHFGDKIGNLFGSKDIDFPGYPAFSDRYYLRGHDEQHIRDFFIPEVLNHFEEYPGCYLEANNYYFILYHTKKLVPPTEYNQFLSFCQRTYQLFREISEDLYSDSSSNH